MSGERSVSLVAGLVRAWVRLYTRGVPAGLRERRRGEIDSDLWEQTADDVLAGRPAAATSAGIVGRLLLGIPADLSWRIEHVNPRRSAARILEGSRAMFQLVTRNAMPLLIGMLGASYLAMAVGVAVDGEFGSTGEQAWYASAMGAAGLLVLAGLAALRRSPRLGAPALGLGAIIGAGLTWWLIVTPALAVGVLVWLLASGKHRRSPATAS